jgi:hypothetical protein
MFRASDRHFNFAINRSFYIKGPISAGHVALVLDMSLLFLSGSAAVWTAIVISIVGHFVVGAGRAVFTGRPACAAALICSWSGWVWL